MRFVSLGPLVATVCMALTGGCGLGIGSSGVGSVGAVFGRDNETHELHVRDSASGTVEGEPALVPGDEVLMIDGHYVRTLSAKDIRAKLRGEVGSRVALTVLRGDEVLHIRVTRSALGDHPAPPPPREETIGR